MVMRVATFATSERMLAASLRTQARMAELQLQEASGGVSTDYGGLGHSTRQLLDLEITLKQSQAYASAASEASGRVEIMYETLSTITDLLTDFRSQLTSMMSADGDETSGLALMAAASGYMDELASLLNTTYEGRYLFAGDQTLVAPIDLDGYTATETVASTSYYQGDSAIAAVKISKEQTVAYGVTADNAAFEQAFRALGLISGSSGTPDAATLEASYELVLSALDSTIGVQSKLSIDAGTLARSTERQADYESFLAAAISALKDADVTQIAVQLTSYETQLQASYAALAKVQSLNLLDYLG